MIPPSNRTPAWAGITEGAGNGKLHLPVCTECGATQYPPQQFCTNCLSDNLHWTAIKSSGHVIAHSQLHVSVEPWFQTKLPVGVALVQLDAGPVVYAFCQVTERGAQVQIEPRFDKSHAIVLHARSQGESE